MLELKEKSKLREIRVIAQDMISHVDKILRDNSDLTIEHLGRILYYCENINDCIKEV